MCWKHFQHRGEIIQQLSASAIGNISPPEATADEGLRRSVTWSVGGPVSRAVVGEVRTRGVVSHTHPVLEAVRHTQEGAGAVPVVPVVRAVAGVGSNSVIAVAGARGVAVTLGRGSFNNTYNNSSYNNLLVVEVGVDVAVSVGVAVAVGGVVAVVRAEPVHVHRARPGGRVNLMGEVVWIYGINIVQTLFMIEGV